LNCDQTKVITSTTAATSAADLLLDVFKAIAKNERELSEVKKILMFKVEFNLVDAFRMFESGGYVTPGTL